MTLRVTMYNRYEEEVIMANYRAIPEGFMTVGELAKKMGVTVRTLQYYDKEGAAFPIGRK